MSTTQTKPAVPHVPTQVTAKPGEMPDMPANLVRKPIGETTGTMKDAAETKAAAAKIAAQHAATVARTTSTPAAPKQPVSSVLREALKGAAVKVVARTKSKGPVVVGKLAAAPKADKPAHKPTTIARTEGNPAKSIVPSKFKALYAEHNDTNGAPLNLALKSYTTVKNADGRDALGIDLLKEVAAANGIDFTRYAHLNNGQMRMNVGNKLAGLIKAGKTVIVGKQRFADPEKALAKPAAVEHAAA